MDWLAEYRIDGALVHSTGTPQYPVIAWNHEFGGLVAEVEKLDGFDAMLPWPVETVRFGRGAKATRKECYGARRAEIAILATKTRWFDRATGERVAGYQDGAFSRLQLLALVKGAESGPFLLSFKGVAAGELSKALTAVRRGPIAAGRRATGKDLAEAAFWLTIYAGKPQTVGQQQATEITPPHVEMPGKGDDALDWLGARYIGPQLMAVINGLASEVTAWATSDGATNGHDQAPAASSGALRPEPWLAPEEADDAADDPFDALPSHDRSAYSKTGADLFWATARGKGRADESQVAIMAKAAQLTGDWSMAQAWLEGSA